MHSWCTLTRVAPQPGLSQVHSPQLCSAPAPLSNHRAAAVLPRNVSVSWGKKGRYFPSHDTQTLVWSFLAFPSALPTGWYPWWQGRLFNGVLNLGMGIFRLLPIYYITTSHKIREVFGDFFGLHWDKWVADSFLFARCAQAAGAALCCYVNIFPTDCFFLYFHGGIFLA